MTELLARRVSKLTAIELDPVLAQSLQEEFRQQPNVDVIVSDVLRVDFSELCRRQGVAQAYVFGNLPYYITSPILHHLFAYRDSIRGMGLLVQREVAERLTAEPGNRDYGYLTVAAQTYSQPDIALAVPPGAFSPPPQVQSALVTFRMKAKFSGWPQSRYDQFLEFVKRCFAQKRKNLLNNLVSFHARADVSAALDEIGQIVTARAEELAVEHLAELFERLRRE
jgi:16S rRNA (adenine1518-N6/adenine1519-N6)-dimethyltransferase